MSDNQQFTDSFNLHADALRDKAAALDVDDLQHAIAGVDVGRHRKHIQDGGIDPATGEKRSTAERIRRTLEWLLLNDQNYARLYEGAVSAVQQAAQTAGDVLERVLTQLADVRDQITDMLDRAATLPDGRKVFRDNDGTVKDENGSVISDDLAAGIVWRGDEPGYEEYLALTEQEDLLATGADELRGIETELGGYQGELGENDPATTPDRLKTITDNSDALRERIESLNTALFHNTQNRENLETTAPDSEVVLEQKSQTVVPTFGSGG